MIGHQPSRRPPNNIPLHMPARTAASNNSDAHVAARGAGISTPTSRIKMAESTKIDLHGKSLYKC